MSCRCFCSFDLNEAFCTDGLITASRGVEVAGVVLLGEEGTESSKSVKRKEGRRRTSEKEGSGGRIPSVFPPP